MNSRRKIELNGSGRVIWEHGWMYLSFQLLDLNRYSYNGGGKKGRREHRVILFEVLINLLNFVFAYSSTRWGD